MEGFVHSLLDAAADKVPDRTALLTDQQRVTYRELQNQTRCLASYLHDLGVKRGDRVAILLPNSVPLVAAIMASSRLGALYIVLNWSTRAYQLEHILADATPRVLLTSCARLTEVQEIASHTHMLTVEDNWGKAMQALPYCGVPVHITQDLASLIYTSGSTGRPKAVMSTHRNIRFAASAIQSCLKMEMSDVVGVFLPLSFDYGLYQVFLAFQVGATLALGTELDAGPLLLQKLNEWQVTGLPLVPSMAVSLLRLCRRPGVRLPALRYITNTGMHLPLTHIQELQDLWPQARIYVMFGQTECKRISILDPEDFARKPHSVGRPLPDTECLIVDSEGQVLPAGSIGELVVRGPHVMAGYWNAPEITEKRFRCLEPSQQTALFTGDFCSFDEDGFLYFHGRQDDVYKQKGYRVSALEVETAALDVEGVDQAALVPYVDDKGAVLFTQGSAEPEDLLLQLHQRLESSKVPDRIVRIGLFPLTANGKIDKKQLKEQFLLREAKA